MDKDEIQKQFKRLDRRITRIENFLENHNFSRYPAADDLAKEELFEEAVRIVCKHDRASASLLQRRLAIGFNRAARLLEQLEEEGVVGPADGAEPRDVLIRNPEDFLKKKT